MPRPKKMPPSDPLLAVAYVGPSEMSASQQDSAIRSLAAERGLRIVETFGDEERLPLPDRRGFVDALVEVERQRAGSFVTHDHTVLASNPALYALALRAVERAGAAWVRSVPELPWPAQPIAEAMDALRQHESMIYRPKVRLGRRGPADRPGNLGGNVPWGFRSDPETGTWIENKAEQRVIRELLKRREAGTTLDELAVYLQGLAMPGRSPKIYRSTIASILKRGGAA